MFGLISITDSTINSHLTSYDTVTLKKDIYSDSAILFSNVYDAFVFLGRRSGPSANSDGYGLAYYKNKSRNPLDSSNLNHQVGFGTYFSVNTDSSRASWEKPLLNAFNSIKQSDSGASIVLGHARTATGGIGNHPFWFHLDTDHDGSPDKTFTFEHNGDCSPLKPMMLNYLLSFDSTWFQKHPLNWAARIPNNDTLNTNYIIDTELLFHFIMAHIVKHNGVVDTGIANALQKLGAFNAPFYHVINFILSDGHAMYAFKITEDGSGYNLEYMNVGGSAVLVKTGQELSFTDIPYFNLLVITREGSVSSFDIRSLATIPEPLRDIKPIIKKNERNYLVNYLTLSGRKISSSTRPFISPYSGNGKPASASSMIVSGSGKTRSTVILKVK